jgi:hypothetical protein
LRVRYWVAKRLKEAQRMPALVFFGLALVAASPFADEVWSERLWKVGGSVTAWAWLRWTAQQQGQRRRDPKTGKELRRPTLRMSPEEAERMQRYLEDRKISSAPRRE